MATAPINAFSSQCSKSMKKQCNDVSQSSVMAMAFTCRGMARSSRRSSGQQGHKNADDAARQK